MARKAKIPNHIKKRLEREDRKRRVAIRPQKQYYLIVCEGEKTEPLYFEAFKNDLPKGVLENTSVEIEGEGRNTLDLIAEVLKIRERREKELSRKYDHVWAVFDRDSFPPQNFNSAIFKALAANPIIKCAWSNEAFELWYLLHFEFYQHAASRDDYKGRLESAVSQRMNGKFVYVKNDKQMYQILKTYGNQEQAIKWAEDLAKRHTGENFADHNPCTKVYELVQELIDLANSSK